jgi:hypothetical protein
MFLLNPVIKAIISIFALKKRLFTNKVSFLCMFLINPVIKAIIGVFWWSVMFGGF